MDGFIDLYEWIKARTPEEFPPEPWALRPGIHVINNSGWLSKIKDECIGDNARKYCGALQDDLKEAYEIWSNLENIRKNQKQQS